jgi:hypothetical protein
MQDNSFNELEDQMVTFTGAQGERSPDRLDSLVWACHPFLKMTMGAPERTRVIKYAQSDAEAEWPGIEELTSTEGKRTGRDRRLAAVHNGAYAQGNSWDLDAFAPVSPDDPVEQRGEGHQGAVHRWRGS